jgi:hypothetical protein
MRYSFDYCIFGFPNNTAAGSNPCITSTACGALENALKDGDLNPLASTQYSYCDVDNKAMTGPAYDKCLACVKAGGDHRYLANCRTASSLYAIYITRETNSRPVLVGLEAGCLQRPVPGKAIGLNDTVFSTKIIGIVDPTPTNNPNANKGPSIPTTTIAAIAISVAVAMLLVAGCLYVQYRKRKAKKAARAAGPWGQRTHRPASSLSFRCQTHLTPMSPRFTKTIEESDVEEKGFADPAEALGSNPISRKNSTWKPDAKAAVASFEVQSDTKGTKEIIGLQNITTALPVVTAPTNVHPTYKFHSPIDDFTTPISAVSAVSTTQLLPIKPYVPAEHGYSSPSLGSQHSAGGNFSPVSGNPFVTPTSATTASPLMSQSSWPLPTRPQPPMLQTLQTQHLQQGSPSQGYVQTPTPTYDGSPVWERGDPQRGFGGVGGIASGGGGLGLNIAGIASRPTGPPAVNRNSKWSTGRNSGSPVETRQIQVVFPGPPTKR